ncbi:MAG: hypothetical protein NVSMB10_06150 [Steroidobacteraceae bacterium]
MQSLESEWAPKNLKVVGIAVDKPEKVRQFAAQYKIRYSLLIGEQDALDSAAAFGMTDPVFPFTVFTDRESNVVALLVGELHPPQAALILGVIDDLNRKRIPLATAKQRITDGLRAMPRQPDA